MLIKIHARRLKMSEGLKKHAESKARLAVGLFGEKIRRIDIFLSDVNGPKGGEDMVCKVKVAAAKKSIILVQEKSETLRDAINTCMHRLKRSAARKFSKVIDHKRMPVSMHQLNLDSV